MPLFEEQEDAVVVVNEQQQQQRGISRHRGAAIAVGISTRTIRVDHRDRRYMVYLPARVTALLDDDKNKTNNNVGGSTTLPVVFTVHCLGCDLTTYGRFYADAYARPYNFVWVNPEGLRHSFQCRQQQRRHSRQASAAGTLPSTTWTTSNSFVRS